MKKQHLYTIIGGTILAVVLLSDNCMGNAKHYIVKLKGNVLYAGHKNKNQQDKDNSMVHIAAAHTQKMSPVKQPELKIQKNEVVAITQQPVVKKQVNSNAIPVVAKTNFQDRLENIHSQIFDMFPGTYLDSVSFVNQLLSDSIRIELAKANTNERSEYLVHCLINSLQDSVTLSKLNTLSSDEPSTKLYSDGVLIAHCKDASNSSNMDSVVMDVFSGSMLMASATSDKAGTIQCKGIPEGNYYVVFSRKEYAPFSLMRVKVSNTGQSYIDIPLTRQDGYLFRTFGKNAWLFVTMGIMLLLAGMVVSAYYLARFNTRRALRTA
ncbi:MAG TPA: carboxypeptidase-like regulatory domain-containing protein [Bacteroidia bacterium]|nr:carboxypeptidase-like regulatory domain-containing protein [Bacteroidia bacterium]